MGLACPNAGEPIADKNVAAAADYVQMAFLIKSLLAAGVSFASIAIIARKNPDDLAKLAVETLGSVRWS